MDFVFDSVVLFNPFETEGTVRLDATGGEYVGVNVIMLFTGVDVFNLVRGRVVGAPVVFAVFTGFSAEEYVAVETSDEVTACAGPRVVFLLCALPRARRRDCFGFSVVVVTFTVSFPEGSRSVSFASSSSAPSFANFDAVVEVLLSMLAEANFTGFLPCCTLDLLSFLSRVPLPLPLGSPSCPSTATSLCWEPGSRPLTRAFVT